MYKVLLVTALVQLGTSANYNDSVRLYDDFIKPYNHRIRPSLNHSAPTTVIFMFNLLNLLSIVEVEQTVNINAWFNFSWVDEIRQWNPDDYGGLESINPDPLDVWRPRTVITNSIKKRDVLDDDYAPLTIFSSGLTVWSPGSIFSSTCVLDMTYFPFDEQSCDILILAKDYGDVINLIAGGPKVRTGGYIPNGEWDMISSELTDMRPTYGGTTFSRLTITFNFKRRPLFYMINVLVPVIFMSLLSTLVFVLPEESGERASFSITVLLSLSVFMGIVSGQLPQNSDSFPIIIHYLFSLLIHNGICVVVCVVQLRWIKIKSKNSNDDVKCELCYKNLYITSPLNNPSSLDGTPLQDSQDTILDAFATPNVTDSRTENENGQTRNSFAISNGRLEKNLNGSFGHTSSLTDWEHQRTRVPKKSDDNKVNKGEDKKSKSVLGGIGQRLQNADVQFFLFFNLVWISISSYFLYRLLYQVK